jgi:DNA-binding transcriptional LysR family regulator
MDFRQLNYFVAVAQELSFSRAAERLHISQPPLSQQIKLLEQDLGVQLFERTRRSVRLTHAGSVFYEQARGILEQYAAARELCAWSLDGRAGRLRIGFTGSVPVFAAFPRLMQAFRRRYPRIELDLLHLSTAEQLQALSEHRLDVGFLRPSPEFRAPASIQARTLWEDELVLALAQGHPAARSRGALDLGGFADEGFILFPRALGCGLFEHITHLAARAGFSVRIAQEARETSTTLALVAAGLGVSIVPDTYAAAKPPGVVFKRIAQPGSGSAILLASTAVQGNASARLFIEHAHEFQLRAAA